MGKVLGGALFLVLALTVATVGWAAAPALQMAGDTPAAIHNAEGIKHYNLGHWKVAYKHFAEAVEEDPNAAEAHYNLALSLDKMGQHRDAAKHFKHAQELGKDNPDIQNSRILKAHVKGM